MAKWRQYRGNQIRALNAQLQYKKLEEDDKHQSTEGTKLQVTMRTEAAEALKQIPPLVEALDDLSHDLGIAYKIAMRALHFDPDQPLRAQMKNSTLDFDDAMVENVFKVMREVGIYSRELDTSASRRLLNVTGTRYRDEVQKKYDVVQKELKKTIDELKEKEGLSEEEAVVRIAEQIPCSKYVQNIDRELHRHLPHTSMSVCQQIMLLPRIDVEVEVPGKDGEEPRMETRHNRVDVDSTEFTSLHADLEDMNARFNKLKLQTNLMSLELAGQTGFHPGPQSGMERLALSDYDELPQVTPQPGPPLPPGSQMKVLASAIQRYVGEVHKSAAFLCEKMESAGVIAQVGQNYNPAETVPLTLQQMSGLVDEAKAELESQKQELQALTISQKAGPA